MRYELIFFDLDGTLASTLEDISASVQRVFRKSGRVPPSAERIRNSVGSGVRQLIQRCLPDESPSGSASLVADFMKDYGEHLMDHTTLFDGVEETLRALGGVKKIVLSNKPEAFTRRVVRNLNVDDLFLAVYGGDSHATRKPDPALAVQCLKEYGVSPERALLVGDSGVDRKTAENAGIDFCGVSYGYRQPGDLDGVEVMLDHFPGLLPLVLGDTAIGGR